MKIDFGKFVVASWVGEVGASIEIYAQYCSRTAKSVYSQTGLSYLLNLMLCIQCVTSSTHSAFTYQ